MQLNLSVSRDLNISLHCCRRFTANIWIKRKLISCSSCIIRVQGSDFTPDHNLHQTFLLITTSITTWLQVVPDFTLDHNLNQPLYLITSCNRLCTWSQLASDFVHDHNLHQNLYMITPCIRICIWLQVASDFVHDHNFASGYWTLFQFA